MDSVFWLCAVTGFSVYGVLILLTGALANLTDTEGLVLVLAPLGLRLLFDGLSVVPAALLFRRMLFRPFAIRSMVANGLGGGLCLAMALAGAGFWALVAGQLVGSAVNLIVVWTSAGWRPRWVFHAERLKDLRAFGLSSTGTRIVNDLRIDHLLIGLVAGSTVLGLYFFARRLFQILTDLTAGVFSPVANVLFASTQFEPDKARQAFQTGGFVVATVGLPLFVGMIVVADTAVPLIFGDHWTEAIFAVQILMLSGLTGVLGTVQAGLINGQGHAGWWLGYQGALQAASVPVVILLYPLFGLEGIVAGMAAVSILLWPLAVRKALSILDLPLRDYLMNLAGPAFATAVMGAAVAAFPLIAPGWTGAARLGAEVAIGIVVYGLCLGVISRGRLLEVLHVLRSRRKAGG